MMAMSTPLVKTSPACFAIRRTLAAVVITSRTFIKLGTLIVFRMRDGFSGLATLQEVKQC